MYEVGGDAPDREDIDMSRTVKWEHKSDGIHTCHKLHRQARPAGRILQVLALEMDEGPEPWDLCFEPAPSDLFEADISDIGPFCHVCHRLTDHFAEHCDLVELGFAYYTDDGSVMWTESGRAWDMLFDPDVPLVDVSVTPVRFPFPT